MTAKQYLSRYRNTKAEIKAKTDQLAELRAIRMNISPSMSDIHGESVSDKLANITAEIIDAENVLADLVQQLLAVEIETRNTIAEVADATLSLLLELKYINGKTLEEIAEKLDYSYRHTRRLHGKALKKIEDVLLCPP